MMAQAKRARTRTQESFKRKSQRRRRTTIESDDDEFLPSSVDEDRSENEEDDEEEGEQASDDNIQDDIEEVLSNSEDCSQDDEIGEEMSTGDGDDNIEKDWDGDTFLILAHLQALPTYEQQKTYFERFAGSFKGKYLLKLGSGTTIFSFDRFKSELGGTVAANDNEDSGESEFFWKRWNGDPNRKMFAAIDYIPENRFKAASTSSSIDDNTFNLFGGLHPKLEFFQDKSLNELRGIIKPWRDVGLCLCEGSTEIQHELELWLAHMVQFPRHRANVAFVFLGKQGVYKDSFFNVFERIFGASNCEFGVELKGKDVAFAQKLFGSITEFDWKRTKQMEGSLKRLITEPKVKTPLGHGTKVTIESPHRVVFLCNHLESLQIDLKSKDRRFVMLNPLPTMRELSPDKADIFKTKFHDRFTNGNDWTFTNAIFTYLMKLEVPQILNVDEMKQICEGNTCIPHVAILEHAQKAQKLKPSVVRFLGYFCQPCDLIHAEKPFTPCKTPPIESCEEIGDYSGQFSVKIRTSTLYQLYCNFFRQTTMEENILSFEPDDLVVESVFGKQVKDILIGANSGVENEEPMMFGAARLRAATRVHGKNNGTPMFEFRTDEVYAYVCRVCYKGIDLSGIFKKQNVLMTRTKNHVSRIEKEIANDAMFH